MRTYETLFIVNPDLTQEDAVSVFEKFKTLVTENGSEIINDEAWGKLRLAYEIERKTEGYYFLIQFNSDVNVPAELEKRFKYDESVIRFIVIKIDGKKFKLKKRSDMTQRAPRRGGRNFRRDGGRQFEKQADTEKEEVETEADAAEEAPADNAEE
ncbi:30S ribosomal protein S6 [Deferribacterales bacterium Es71-Z0220]|uniref:30S ribosomal protein S6 n=1 Tax=Deferrivibrio essentukiensis TaxID=2880922 RepID=UPI001F618EA3|nr:30S ribosomal protein S6 [Deferrivibrio essentukiensis]MCB4203711.1 30S ribosomal protein S6 [Deferrivibrio essentukiensis]